MDEESVAITSGAPSRTRPDGDLAIAPPSSAPPAKPFLAAAVHRAVTAVLLRHGAAPGEAREALAWAAAEVAARTAAAELRPMVALRAARSILAVMSADPGTRADLAAPASAAPAHPAGEARSQPGAAGSGQARPAPTDDEAGRRDLLATLDLGAFMARDIDGTIRHWSKGCERLYGWTAEEAVGRISHDLLRTVTPLPLAELEAILERDGEWVGELRHRDRHGRPLVLMARKVLRRAAQGRPAAVLEVLTDITDQRQAEAALQKSEATLDAVLEALPVGVAIADSAGRILRGNAALRELWGVPPNTERWQDYGRWIGRWPQTGQRIAAEEWAMARALLEGEVVRGELVECERFGTGELRFCLNSAAPIRGPAGEVVGAVVGALDVTFRHLAEVALAASEERFRAIAETAPCILFEADMMGRVTYASPYCQTFTGLPGDDLVGEGWLRMIHPDDRARATAAWTLAVRREEPCDIEYRLRRRDGAYRWFLARSLPRRDVAGDGMGWVGICLEVDDILRPCRTGPA